jgi:hypothetical protein
VAQGIFVNHRRPKSKKEIMEAVKADPSLVSIEATSLFGNEFEGNATEMPENKVIYFVGPDPYTKRNFYGQISRVGERITVR